MKKFQELDFFNFENSDQEKKIDNFQDSFNVENFQNSSSNNNISSSAPEFEIDNLIRRGLETSSRFKTRGDYSQNSESQVSNFNFDFNLTSPKDPNKILENWSAQIQAPFASSHRKFYTTEKKNFENIRANLFNSIAKKNCLSTLENTPKEEAKQRYFKTQEKVKIHEALKIEHCNCKKSKCLKLYCECFRKGKFCLEDCKCVNCLNTVQNSRIIHHLRNSRLKKNPDIFNSKFMKIELNDGIVAEVHKKGCNCKKSKCLKNYCECFRNGSGCSKDCGCVSCENGKIEAGIGKRDLDVEFEDFVQVKLKVEKQGDKENYSFIANC